MNLEENDVEALDSVADVVDVEPLVLPPQNLFDAFAENPTPEPPKPQKPAEKKPLIGTPKNVPSASATKAPPSVDEWQKFFAKIVIRGITSGYLWMVLRDIEEELTPAEREMITLQPDELMELAAPFASFSVKSKFLQKHGRSIVAFADSYESFIGLWFWMRRVNKIAKRHRKAAPVPGYVVQEETSNGFAGPDERYEPQQYNPGYFSGSGA